MAFCLANLARSDRFLTAGVEAPDAVAGVVAPDVSSSASDSVSGSRTCDVNDSMMSNQLEGPQAERKREGTTYMTRERVRKEFDCKTDFPLISVWLQADEWEGEEKRTYPFAVDDAPLDPSFASSSSSCVPSPP